MLPSPARGPWLARKAVKSSKGVRRTPLDRVAHELFCTFLLTERFATDAAIRAGYTPSGARTQACRLLTRADIRSRLAGMHEKALNRKILRKREDLVMLSEERGASWAAFADVIGKTAEEAAVMVKTHPYARAIKGLTTRPVPVKVTERSGKVTERLEFIVVDVELKDSFRASDALGKRLGWNEAEKVAIAGGVIAVPMEIEPEIVEDDG